MLISVITTFYNSDQFIDDAIASVKRIKNKQEIEYILVNDGSDDQTLSIIESQKEPFMHIINPGRIGRGNALNLGVKESKGNFICILDADDIINPQWIDAFIDYAKKSSNLISNYDIFYGDVILMRDFNAKHNFNDKFSIEDSMLTEPNKDKIFFYNYIPHSGVIYKKSLMGKAEMYSSNLSSQFDWDLWFKARKKMLNILKIDQCSAFKRLHANQFFERSNFGYFFKSIILQLSWTFRIKKMLILPVLLFCFLRMLWRYFPFKHKVYNSKS